MYIDQQWITAQEAVAKIEQFIKQQPHAFYYVETVTHYELKPVAQLKEKEGFQYIRLFSLTGDLQIRRIQGGYRFVELGEKRTPILLDHKQASREIYLDVKENKFSRLLLDIYTHEEHGIFEHWKGVQK